MKFSRIGIEAQMVRKGFMTYAELAKAANLSRQTVSQAARSQECSVQTASKLASALECDIADLMQTANT